MRDWFYNFLWKSDKRYKRSKAFLKKAGRRICILMVVILAIYIFLTDKVKVPGLSDKIQVTIYVLVFVVFLLGISWLFLGILHWISISFLKNFKEIKHKVAEHEIGHLVVQWEYYPNSVKKVEIASASKIIEEDYWGATEWSAYPNIFIREKAGFIKGYNKFITKDWPEYAEIMNLIFKNMKIPYRVKPLKEVEPLIKTETPEDNKKLINIYLAGILAEVYFKDEMYKDEEAVLQRRITNFAINYTRNIFEKEQLKFSDGDEIKRILLNIFEGQDYLAFIEGSANEVVNIFMQKHENFLKLKQLLIKKRKLYRRQFRKYL